ncbi:MAG: DUF3153 domain-containing protein [Drouetiella hepatica Uher 2000/2452]|jgi:hypothetical protein|uniref:DUF3153 domain-containing protein n=1 Tax=Drouetiella hepatica Uher 2000/2452 TaxID=904376 RepID=A0A951UKG5_9CYAN|nr:DUF3153 domain-containing protein [Drouetiella hepatica Uher 2000/2452]
MSRTLSKRKTIAQILIKFRLLWLILVAFFLLSGCVRDDISIRFSDANHGRFVQQIRIAQPVTELEGVMAIAWLERLEHQTESLGGWVQHPGSQESILTLPFFNVKDLETKFNQLFASEFETGFDMGKLKNNKFKDNEREALPTIASHLKMRSGNWIFWQRMVLDCELDLRSLNEIFVRGVSEPGASSGMAKVAIDPRQILSLEFRLSTPWGARALETAHTPARRSQGRQLIWKLEPGEMNHIAAIFWVPSPIGTGAMLIVFLMLIGLYIKAQSPKVLTDS